MPKSVIDSELCVRCGRCRQNCRFDAIDEDFRVILHACEGCAVCSVVCPSGAVTMVPSVSGELMLYERDAVFSTAQLKMGSGTSGKLVTEVKKQLKSVKRETELVIIDGSPGIGCPVIASISGVDMVLIVAEPSVSGLSDMKRVIQTAEHFKVPVAVCINKYDLNKGIGDQIVAFCGERSIPFTGMIPYDHQAVKAINAGVSITQLDCPSGQAVREVYRRTHSLLFPV